MADRKRCKNPKCGKRRKLNDAGFCAKCVTGGVAGELAESIGNTPAPEPMGEGNTNTGADGEKKARKPREVVSEGILKELQDRWDALCEVITDEAGKSEVKQPKQSAFILDASQHGFTVKAICTFLDKPYRQVFGIIWRKKTNYKPKKKAKTVADVQNQTAEQPAVN